MSELSGQFLIFPRSESTRAARSEPGRRSRLCADQGSYTQNALAFGGVRFCFSVQTRALGRLDETACLYSWEHGVQIPTPVASRVSDRCVRAAAD